jgi:predicted ATPase/DNA-binding SARP family transcriptional activator
MIRVLLLGPLEVHVDGQPIALGGHRQQALLALLALHPNEPLSRDRLLEAVWGADAPATARHAVHVYVSRIRRALGPEAGRLTTAGGGYALRLERTDVDALRAEDALARGRTALEHGDPSTAVEMLRDALALWRGVPLAGLEYEPWAQPEVARLEELRLACVEERIEAELALGQDMRLVPELEELVREHPLRERPRGQLMLALYRSGRQAEALSVYTEARLMLVEELGLEPSAELRDLHVAILRQDPSLAVEPPELRARRHLPAPPTPLVGRRREVDDVVALLSGDARLVTLTGPAGTGKTRLALQAAYELAERFPDGVYFVDLAPLRDPDLVTTTIAGRLGLEERSGRPLRLDLASYLRTRTTLIVLDNFEHVDAAAPVAAELLREAEGLRVLVTSRIALRVYGEHEYPVEPLLLHEEAVPLFAARAAAVAPGSGAPRGAVAELCARLDCLPLAIELAAARARDLPVADVLGSFEQRLRLATGGPRDVPARQQTLRGAIEWSYDLLADSERRAFPRLGVFLGGFSREAAEHICGADVETLKSLTEANLLRTQDGRFGFLEAIHEYAVEQLEQSGSADRVRRRHAETFARLAMETVAELRGRRQLRAIERLETEHDNLRGALTWALAADPPLAARLAGSLHWFWQVRSHLDEGRRWLNAALQATPEAAPSVRAPLLQGAGQLAYYSGDLESAERLLHEAVASWREAEDPSSLAIALAYLAIAGGHGGSAAVARAAGEEAIRSAEDLDEWTVGLALWSHGTNTFLGRAGRTDVAEAQRLLERSLAALRPTGDQWAIAAPLYYLGVIAAQTGDDHRAAEYVEEAAEAFRAVGDKWRLRLALVRLAKMAERAGDEAKASALAREAEALARELPRDPLLDRTD